MEDFLTIRFFQKNVLKMQLVDNMKYVLSTKDEEGFNDKKELSDTKNVFQMEDMFIAQKENEILIRSIMLSQFCKRYMVIGKQNKLDFESIISEIETLEPINSFKKSYSYDCISILLLLSFYSYFCYLFYKYLQVQSTFKEIDNCLQDKASYTQFLNTINKDEVFSLYEMYMKSQKLFFKELLSSLRIQAPNFKIPLIDFDKDLILKNDIIDYQIKTIREIKFKIIFDVYFYNMMMPLLFW